MAKSVSWVNLIIILVLMVFLNVILLREHFVDKSFSDTLLSMLTIDPGSPFSQKCNLGPASPSTDSTPSSSPGLSPSPSSSPDTGPGFAEDDLVPAPAILSPASPAVLTPATPPALCPSTAAPAPAPTTTQCSQDSLLESIKRTIKSDINDAISQLKLQELQKPPQVITAPAPASRSECTDQGLDYNQVKDDTCGMLIHPPFDPNEYIRKDEIPCWGCSLTD